MNDLSGLGKQPISDAQPCGNDVRDEPDFELLQDEIGKLSNPFANSSVDWNRVSALSAALLADKGKDMLVACYLAGGLLRTSGLPGLRDGLQVLADLLQTHWDGLYPPLQRIRARRNAMQWLIDRVKADGDERDWSSLPPQDAELVDGLRGALNAIDAILVGKDDDAPSLRPLLTLTNSIPVAELVKPPPETPAADTGAPTANGSGANPAPSAAASTTPAPGQTPLDSAESVEKATGEALDRLAEIGAWLADADPLAASGFRLRRIAAWTAIEAAPPAHGGQTMLPGPVQPVQDALKGLLGRLDNDSLINFTEAQLQTFPFWLDLNCVAAQALGRLGERGEAARREVCNETARLLARLPGVEDLKFASGMPFATADTKQWLQTLGAAASGDAPAAPDALEQALQRARALAADDLGGAAAFIQQAIAQRDAPASRLRLRIALCELLFEHRPGAHLDPFARALIAEVDRFELDVWDAPLAIDGLRAAYAILARNDENRAEADALLARIAPLDAAAAVLLVT
ncbi:type VI secretion system protein VasJ [Paraburkholderia caballeronis]|uniref:type VI secretion system protein TssA n=1 Tax=Paraburkholderia caballeronis TaxID=416943 RepID=UPI0010653584|nr:type VI secretion system protein TssA [Paraburkholderia caballeronis]TDV28722.1 type VI secretion system protein VasJ [Paraburkholderia caballeronis]